MRSTESQQTLKCFSELRKSKSSYNFSDIFPLYPKSHLHGSFLYLTLPTTWVLPAFTSFSLSFLQISLVSCSAHIEFSQRPCDIFSQPITSLSQLSAVWRQTLPSWPHSSADHCTTAHCMATFICNEHSSSFFAWTLHGLFAIQLLPPTAAGFAGPFLLKQQLL